MKTQGLSPFNGYYIFKPLEKTAPIMPGMGRKEGKNMDKKKVLVNMLVASEAIIGTWNLVIACRGLYDDITCRQERRWYVNCMNVDKVLNALRMRGIKYDAGSCGWVKAPSIWFVRFKCNGSVYAGLCREINERHVTVFNDNIGY